MNFPTLSRSSRAYAAIATLGLALLVGGCNQAPPPSSAKGYVLEVRGGTSNLGSTFFNPASLSAAQKKKRLLQMRELLANKLALQIAPQATQAVGINLYASLLKDGAPAGQPASLQLRGPQGNYAGSYSLEANQAWDVFFPLVSKGSGQYAITATVGGVMLSNGVTINLATASLLPMAKGLSISATAKDLLASWEAVAGARSYLALIYDNEAQKFIWASATKTPQVQTEASI
jgi:hypothetical protein